MFSAARSALLLENIVKLKYIAKVLFHCHYITYSVCTLALIHSLSNLFSAGVQHVPPSPQQSVSWATLGLVSEMLAFPSGPVWIRHCMLRETFTPTTPKAIYH